MSTDSTMRRRELLCEVTNERKRQNEKWGEQNHDPFAWSAILSEEVGEFSQAVLKARFEYGAHLEPSILEQARQEAIQVAAVAIQIVECLDRGKWRWGSHARGGARCHE